ncbi:hypothetical protein [Alteraurantiacibacter buctensis]|uniref:Peptidase n=1 Tax=Alteraurantiacibacter buctensis TaxID=1503981 RepID=A0A844YSR4_9SPHN|nr:hypothetical protein [Alteraurantiacibacter buctensis]MXO71385.1 hypothetical protein [Alteraurantiacibacter buctensis]
MNLPLGKAALLAGAAIVSALVPAVATAQEARNLDRATSDVLIFEGEVTTTPLKYRYTIPARTRLQVDVIPAEGSSLDPTLTITDVRTGEVLAEDDDSGGNLAARANILSERGQQVEITVSPFGFLEENETAGAFTLELRPRAWVRPVTRRVTTGSDTTGRLSVGGTQLFTIEGRAGQVLEVALVAAQQSDEEVTESAFDPYLKLYKGEGIDGELLSENDDNGSNLNSLIRYTLPEDGIYTLEASPYGDTAGEFTLRVAAPRETHVDGETQLAFGAPLAGFVQAAYGELEGDEQPPAAIYSLSPDLIAAIRGGQGEVTFNLTKPLSEDPDFPGGVDPMLELGFETPLGFATMKSDDDSGGELNARIPIDLSAIAADGDWLERLRLRATSIGEAGGFSIEAVPGLQEVVAPSWDEYAIEAAAEAVEDAAEAVENAAE